MAAKTAGQAATVIVPLMKQGAHLMILAHRTSHGNFLRHFVTRGHLSGKWSSALPLPNKLNHEVLLQTLRRGCCRRAVSGLQ